MPDPAAARANFETELTPHEEQSFQAWKRKNAPNDSGVDYDLRGAFKAGLSPSSTNGHWPDTYKKPNHPTFSNESIYAGPDAPSWRGGSLLVDSRGRVLADETPQLGNKETGALMPDEPIKPPKGYTLDPVVTPPPGYKLDAPAEDARKEPESDSSRFFSKLWNEANPVSVLGGMGDSMLHPINTIKGYLAQNSDLANKAEEAFKRGDHGQAAKHFGDLLLQVVPGFGAKSDEAGRQISEGDMAGGLGKAAGAALGVVETTQLPKLMRGTAGVVSKVPAAGAAVADAVTQPGVVKALGHAADYGIAGSAMHGNIPGVAVGVGARVAAGALEDWAARRAATRAKLQAATAPPVQEAPAPSPAGPIVETPAPAGGTPAAPSPGGPRLTPQQPQLPANHQGQPIGEPEPASPPAKSKVVTIPSPKPEFPKKVFEEAARADKADALAKVLHENGIPYEDAKLMGPKEWAMAAEGAGVKAPSALSAKQALFRLKRLEKAAGVAQQLQDEMSK